MSVDFRVFCNGFYQIHFDFLVNTPLLGEAVKMFFWLHAFCEACVMTVALCMVGAVSGTTGTAGPTLNPEPQTPNPKP